MRIRSLVSMAVLGALLGAAATAQQVRAPRVVRDAPRLDAVDHAERLARIARTGDLGFPMLPPVRLDSPHDDLIYADRFPVGQEPFASAGDSGTPVVQSGWIPPGASGTGTPIGEIFKYQVPVGYTPAGPARPMVIGYHGYGASAGSVDLQSTIDEEANARGWFYLAPTGLDDQLFGPPISQQNTAAAIQWMFDHYNIDEDRVYMVGFSMGGGVVANFAARHRDPEGMMIAALGIVSGTYDWEQAYNTGSASLKALMENPYNFGGSPIAEPFRYFQASDLRFLPSTYPPLPGTLYLPDSMSTNLGSTPTYVVWDTGDALVDVINQGPHLVATLQDQGTLVDFHTVTGTVNPANGLPAPHSWTVLDEADLFDFFDGKSVDRTPAEFSAQLDLGASVSWVQLEQRFLDMFSFVDGAAEPGAIVVDAVSNATFLTVDMAEAGVTGTGPFDVYAASANAGNFKLRVTGLACPPAYFLDATTGLLVPGTASDPLTGSLIKQVLGTTPLDMQLVCDPAWTTSLTTSPDVVAPGGALTLSIDAPATSTLAWMVIGVNDALTPVKGGNTIAVDVAPPAFLVVFALDGNGDLVLPATIPSGGALSGTTFLLQTVAVDAGFAVDSISNLWRLEID